MVEVAAVVSVIGMLLAVALPTLGRTVQVSKHAEASEQLETMYQAAAAYYAIARPGHGQDGRNVFCLPAAAGPTPAEGSVDPVHVDFLGPTVPGASTWSALGFAPSVPLRFRYSFDAPVTGCTFTLGTEPVWLRLRAEADLDGDGTYSLFERRARILPNGELRAEPVLHVEDRIE